ncbi:UNVERIFIED_CONTAM: hypothetical protein RMT77_014741 [Armadillidium vulgare]
MKVVILLVLGIGSTFGFPAKLDNLLASPSLYYIPPAQPSGLYELPENTTTTTTTTSTTPPPTSTPTPTPPTSPRTPPGVVTKKPVPKSGKMLMPYEFSYGVDDPDSGNYYSHSETSDGQNMKGKYSVLLPDGRLQVVKFGYDPVRGYRANVSYIYQ